MKYLSLVAMACSLVASSPLFAASFVEPGQPLCVSAAEVIQPGEATGLFGQVSSPSDPRIKIGLSPREDAEAEFLAFTLRDSLTASNADYERIQTELASIRDQHPELADVTYTGWYEEGELLVSLYPENPLIDTSAYDARNHFFRLCSDRLVAEIDGIEIHQLKFPIRLNAARLAQDYTDLTMPNVFGVASPNEIGNLEDYIYIWAPAGLENTTASADERIGYLFEDGWYDCFDGCDCKDFMEFETLPSGEVTLVQSYSEYILPGTLCEEFRDDE